jgi:hypothetical protein
LGAGARACDEAVLVEVPVKVAAVSWSPATAPGAGRRTPDATTMSSVPAWLIALPDASPRRQ